MLELISSITIEFDDITEELSRSAEKVISDPEQLDLISQKLQLIFNLQKKHQVSSVDELLNVQSDLENQANIAEKQDIIEQSNDKEEIQNNITSTKSKFKPNITKDNVKAVIGIDNDENDANKYESDLENQSKIAEKQDIIEQSIEEAELQNNITSTKQKNKTLKYNKEKPSKTIKVIKEKAVIKKNKTLSKNVTLDAEDDNTLNILDKQLDDKENENEKIDSSEQVKIDNEEKNNEEDIIKLQKNKKIMKKLRTRNN